MGEIWINLISGYQTINDIPPIMIIETPEEDPIVIEIPYIPPKQIFMHTPFHSY